MSLIKFFNKQVVLSPSVHQQYRCMKTVVKATLLCDKCYYDVDHKTDIKYVFCTRQPSHKQKQRNNSEYRLRQNYYYYGLRDLEAPEKYINCRVQDLGYHNRSKKLLNTLRNDLKFDGLKAISQRASEITGAPSPLKKLKWEFCESFHSVKVGLSYIFLLATRKAMENYYVFRKAILHTSLSCFNWCCIGVFIWCFTKLIFYIK